MTLHHIYELCTQLQSISGTKAKQQFLIDNRRDELDEFLKWNGLREDKTEQSYK